MCLPICLFFKVVFIFQVSSLLSLSQMPPVFSHICDYYIHKLVKNKKCCISVCCKTNFLYTKEIQIFDRMSLREEIVVYGFGKLPWKRLGETILVPHVESHFSCSVVFCRSSMMENPQLPLTIYSSISLLVSVK